MKLTIDTQTITITCYSIASALSVDAHMQGSQARGVKWTGYICTMPVLQPDFDVLSFLCDILHDMLGG